MLKATCTSKFNNIKIDVTYQDNKHNGLRCVSLVKEYLEKYASLRYLVLPLKQFIFNSDLNDPYHGGITSYGLILMIVTFLQLRIQQKIDISTTEPNLGLLLIEFMNFYMNFDYTGTQVIPAGPEMPLNSTVLYQKNMHLFGEFAQMMHIVDPLNPTNNVSRTAHKFYILRVRGLFILEHLLYWVLFCLLHGCV